MPAPPVVAGEALVTNVVRVAAVEVALVDVPATVEGARLVAADEDGAAEAVPGTHWE